LRKELINIVMIYSWRESEMPTKAIKFLLLLVSIILVFLILYAILKTEYDLILYGGKIVDGTGKGFFKADIGIRNGKIAKISRWKLRFARSSKKVKIDGLIVSPGFIDVHTHIEPYLLTKGPFIGENFLRQGITTLITGNCGTSLINVKELSRWISKKGSLLNIATLIGYNSLWENEVHGSYRKLLPPEIRNITKVLCRSLEDGALGLSIGPYRAGNVVALEDIEPLLKIVAERGGVFAIHLRDEGVNQIEALKEALSIADKTGVTLVISHFKLSGPINWGKAEGRLNLIEGFRKKGVKVFMSQYPYTASSTSLDFLMPLWAKKQPTKIYSLLRDSRSREKIKMDIIRNLENNGWKDLSFAYIAWCRTSELNGMNIKNISSIREFLCKPTGLQTSKISNQVEVVLDLIERGGAQMIYHDINENDMLLIAKYPYVVFCSDSGVRTPGVGQPHPRGYGAFPRIFSYYVKEKKILSLEEAVKRMTYLPSLIYQIKNRGLIREGYWADITIFDYDEIQDLANFSQPFLPPKGIKYVIVNGEVVLNQNNIEMKFSGKFIRRAF
jgi:N-acyl-D-amino-acid deacylase